MPNPFGPATPRRLPVVPLPGLHESLPSWLNRIGLLYQIRQPETLAALGLTVLKEMRPTMAGLALAPTSVAAISATTGVPAETIGSMLLSRFAATALPNFPATRNLRAGALRTWTAGAWVFRRHSNFCPTCLAQDGQWRLEWKLPWSFTCPEHRVYLHNRCPRCERAQSGLSWGRDTRACQLRPQATDRSLTSDLPLPDRDTATVCGGRLDEGATVPVTDRHAFEGQLRLLRWLYGTPSESGMETEFASLTALAAQRLTQGMLSKSAQADLRSADRFNDNGSAPAFNRGEPELSPLWADPLRMAAAAHVAHRLSTHEYRPELAIEWLTVNQPPRDGPIARQMVPGEVLQAATLVFGPFNHYTKHIREALRAGLVSLPYTGPTYVNALSPYRLHPQAQTSGSRYLSY